MAHLSAKTSVGPIPPFARPGADEGTSLHRLAASALVLGLVLLGAATDVRAERICANDWRAELISAEGIVELHTPTGWEEVSSGALLCAEDTLRTGPFSGASIRIPDQGTIARIDAETVIRFRVDENETHSWYKVFVKLLTGVMHVISRDPRWLAFDTPFANAGIEGTELVLEVTPDGTTVRTIEGEVILGNEAGVVSVRSGTTGVAGRGATPTAAASADALSAIEWTRRFAPILDGRLPDPDAAPATSESSSAGFYAARAASRLQVGDVREARADLETALALDPAHGDALAELALIALSEGDRGRGLELAERAIAGAPGSPAPWLALSHAARAMHDGRRALEGAEKAVDLAPDHAYAWARVAELRFAGEDYRGAREAAQQAIALDPGAAHARVVLGFAELSGGSTAAAEAMFREAARADDSDPYARLGLGLALYRLGQTEAGREEVEIAVALDPTNPIIRSYVGKLYDAENRDELGGTVLEIAKELDTGDSTGWYYDALRKQDQNRPVEALLDFRRSFDRTGRQSVYGGQLPLDEDLAARSAGIGRLHSELGVQRLGQAAAWRALFDDPADYSAHRLLADLYPYRPRYQLARVNEVHQAIMLQPLNVTPFQPQLMEAHPYLLDVIGPSPMAFQEYHPIVRRNGWSYQLSGVTASNGTGGADLAVNGLHDRVSYNIGLLDFGTDGLRPNNDFDERVLSAVVQARTSESTTVTAQLRSSDIEKGDLPLRFDPDAYFPALREGESVDSAALGVRHVARNSEWLATIIAEDVDATFTGLGPFSQSTRRRGTSFDVQNIRDVGAWTLTSGARHLHQEQIDRLSGPSSPVIPPGAADVSRDVRHSSIYVYGNVKLSEALRATIGGSVEAVETYSVSRERFEPKLGLMWDASPRTTVRAALVRKLQSPFISKHNVQPTLEPTHVVGINQQFFGAEGADTWRYGVALDHEFNEKLFAGIELSRREIDVPLLTVQSDSPTPSYRLIRSDERSHLAYVYWLATPSISFAASYEYEEFDGNGAILPEGFGRARTHRVPLRATFSHPSGLSASVTTRFVDQAGTFTPFADTVNADAPARASDRFWSTDLSLRYRLPSWHGQVALNVLNATDEEFRFQDSDPENPRLLPDRLVQLAFTVSY